MYCDAESRKMTFMMVPDQPIRRSLRSCLPAIQDSWACLQGFGLTSILQQAWEFVGRQTERLADVAYDYVPESVSRSTVCPTALLRESRDITSLVP